MAKKRPIPDPKILAKLAGRPRKSRKSDSEEPIVSFEKMLADMEGIIGHAEFEESLREYKSILHLEAEKEPFEFEDAEAYKKSGDSKKVHEIVPYKEKMFCPDRIKDIFTQLGFEIEEVYPLDFIIDDATLGKIFVRICPTMPIIRLLIPAIFRKKLGLAKVQAWCCEVMSKFTTVRMCSDDNSEDVFMCIDFHYEMDLYVDHLMHAVACISDVSAAIYAKYPDILDNDAIAETP